tara:strand:- start:569 stop:754 length:186 start_codon:yes stop_codon:yes gene_type:complete
MFNRTGEEMTIEETEKVEIDLDIESSLEVLTLEEIDEMVDDLLGEDSLTTYINRLEEMEIY